MSGEATPVSTTTCRYLENGGTCPTGAHVLAAPAAAADLGHDHLADITDVRFSVLQRHHVREFEDAAEPVEVAMAKRLLELADEFELMAGDFAGTVLTGSNAYMNAAYRVRAALAEPDA